MRKPYSDTVSRAETTEEIIGVLTAISVVSKRLAQKLAILEPPPKERKSDKHGAKAGAAAPP